MNAVERALQTKNLLWYNFLLWLGLCLFETLRTYSFTASFNFDFASAYLIRWPISVCLTLWMLSFGVFQFFLITRPLRRRSFVLLNISGGFIFGILFWFFSPLVGLLLERLFLESESLTIKELWKVESNSIFNILLGFIVYWAILIILLAINYYRRFQDQYARSIDLENRLGASQLKSMKMQLHPHFLFNAFNTIVMMVRQKKNKEAVTMLTNLSDMLRQSLSKETNQFVKLGEEMELLKKYLSIESERYKERLRIEWDIDMSLADQLVPSLVLQPIVENAFKHGISKNLDTSVLKISSKQVDNYLELEVYNTGSLLPDNWNFQKDKGIGMANTASRLMKLYKEDFKFLINEKEDGVSIILHLPIKNGSGN